MVAVFVLGPECLQQELREGRIEIASLEEATVVVSDAQSFSSMSPTRRQEVIEGRIGIVA